MDSISTVGFPIVAFFMLFYLIVRTIKENTKALQELNKCIREIESALNRNPPGRFG